MRFGPRAVESRRFARRGRPAAGWARALLAVLGLLAAPTLTAQGTPAGTRIRNWATLAFDAGAQSYVVASDTVDFLVGQVAGVDLRPPRFSIGAAGTAVVFAHTLTNLGNGPDSFTVTAVSARGWPVRLYRDWDGDGLLGAGDSLLTGPVPLTPGSAASLLARVAIPGAASPGVSDTITVTATSRFSPAVSSSVQDRLDVSSAPVAVSLTNTGHTNVLVPALSLSKQLTSPAVALVGQQVHYTLRYANAAGAAPALSAVLTDTLPTGLQYLSATSAPAVAGQVLTWSLGTLAAGDSGAIDLVAVVAPTVRDTVLVRNLAYLHAQGTAAQAAAAAQVALVGPPSAALGLDFTADVLEGGVGEASPYTLIVRNPGTLTVTSMRIRVQLPVGARYVPGSAIGP